jgi:hypothetical protein
MDRRSDGGDTRALRPQRGIFAPSSHEAKWEVKNQIEFKEMNYGNEARQQTSEGDRRRLQARSQRQAAGTRAHVALLEKPTSLIFNRLRATKTGSKLAEATKNRSKRVPGAKRLESLRTLEKSVTTLWPRRGFRAQGPQPTARVWRILAWGRD